MFVIKSTLHNYRAQSSRVWRAQKAPAATQANFFLQEPDGGAYSASAGRSSRVVHARTCAAYSSEASRADPELVPGVNTCTLNNREFLAIIERRAGPDGFRCALLLSLSRLITLHRPWERCLAACESVRGYRCCLLISRRCTEAGIVYAEVVFTSGTRFFFI